MDFFGLAALLALLWPFLKRRKRWDDIFDKDDDVIVADGAGRFSVDGPDVEYNPYQYNPVGTSPTPYAYTSAPNSPPMSFNRALTPDRAYALAITGHHSHNLSMSSGTGAMARPSTAGSTQPLAGGKASSHRQNQSITSTPSPRMSGNWNPPPGTYTAGTMTMYSEDATSSSAYSQDNRSGSPMGPQGQRPLHIANLGSPTSPGSLVDVSTPAQAQAHQAFQVDGKGRMLMTGDPQPVVHTDGGSVDMGTPGPSAPTAATPGPGVGAPTPAPPAYEL